MSIDYFAVRADEVSAARAIVEGDVPKNVDQLEKERLARSIEQAVPDFQRFQKDRSAIAESEGMTVEEALLQFSSIELNWDRDSYVQVIVDDHVVSIHHGHGGGDPQLATLRAVLHLLDREGLSTYDPQNDDMLTPDQF
jgi:hypothetical protein